MKISQWPKKGINFVEEVYIELKRVTWLTRKETIKYTLIVIGVCLALASFLGGLDFLFSWLLNKFVL
ncbi:preprotein translocase subunit SecE [Patescibacteria group bacterium]